MAKGRGQQEFFDLFGTRNTRMYQRLVSNIDVGQRKKFNPSSPTDTSPMDAPFLVERHSGVGFDELVPNSDLFTTLIAEYPSISYLKHWIVIDNSSGSRSTLVAKGRGRQAFFNLFGIKNCEKYCRLVSSVEVGQKTKFNPSTPTYEYTSPADAPFLVERLSIVEFDELEQPDSDLFTTLIAEYRTSAVCTPIIKVGIDQEHPMIKLLISSGGKKMLSKAHATYIQRL